MIELDRKATSAATMSLRAEKFIEEAKACRHHKPELDKQTQAASPDHHPGRDAREEAHPLARVGFWNSLHIVNALHTHITRCTDHL